MHFAVILVRIYPIIYPTIGNIEMLHRRVQTARSLDHIRGEAEVPIWRNINSIEQRAGGRRLDQLFASADDIERVVVRVETNAFGIWNTNA